MVGLLGEKFTFFNSLGATKISRSLRLSIYINVVLLINFPEEFKLCLYFKYSRSYKDYKTFETDFSYSLKTPINRHGLIEKHFIATIANIEETYKN